MSKQEHAGLIEVIPMMVHRWTASLENINNTAVVWNVLFRFIHCWVSSTYGSSVCVPYFVLCTSWFQWWTAYLENVNTAAVCNVLFRFHSLLSLVHTAAQPRWVLTVCEVFDVFEYILISFSFIAACPVVHTAARLCCVPTAVYMIEYISYLFIAEPCTYSSTAGCGAYWNGVPQRGAPLRACWMSCRCFHRCVSCGT